MPKGAPLFRCSNCDAQFPKWSGRCFGCGRWGTVEESAPSAPEAASRPAAPAAKSLPAAQVAGRAPERVPTGSAELDRVLGGGLVPGSLVLVAGEPGVGKSTLLLSLAERLGGRQPAGSRVLYVCGEESPEQIALRMRRMGCGGERLSFLTETDAAVVAATARAERPALVIVDSVQTLRSQESGGEPGGIGELRAAIAQLAEVAKKDGITTLLIGQVTKDGSVAGPKTLEHLVDVVLTVEGDGVRPLRLVRAAKNRFGSNREVGLFEMADRGLVDAGDLQAVDVRAAPVPGTAMAVVREGNRTLLLEVQALTNKTAFGYPVRRASGFDTNRLNVLLAVLERRGGLALAQHDVYVNVAGGLSLEEPAADLPVAMAIASSALGTALPARTGLYGEIGLTGEVRAAPDARERAADAARLGLTETLGPAALTDVRAAIAWLKKKNVPPFAKGGT